MIFKIVRLKKETEEYKALGFEQLNGHNNLKKLNSEFKAAIST